MVFWGEKSRNGVFPLELLGRLAGAKWNCLPAVLSGAVALQPRLGSRGGLTELPAPPELSSRGRPVLRIEPQTHRRDGGL